MLRDGIESPVREHDGLPVGIYVDGYDDRFLFDDLEEVINKFLLKLTVFVGDNLVNFRISSRSVVDVKDPRRRLRSLVENLFGIRTNGGAEAEELSESREGNSEREERRSLHTYISVKIVDGY